MSAPPVPQGGGTVTGILWMNAAMAAFTVNDALMKLATETMPVMQAIALRGAISGAGLAAVAAATGAWRLRMSRHDGWLLVLRTLAEVGAAVTFLMALGQMPLANLSAILQSLPLAVTLAAALVFRERVGWRRMAAIAVGFAGVLLIVRPGTAGFTVWSVLGLASVGFVVVRDLATRRFSAGLPSATVAAVTAVAVGAAGLAGVPLQGGWQAMQAGAAGAVAAAAVALIVGYIAVVEAMRHGDVAAVAPFRYASLIWAIGLGWAVFGTLPDLWTWAGAVLVVGSGLFALWREAALRRAARAARAAAGA